MPATPGIKDFVIAGCDLVLDDFSVSHYFQGFIEGVGSGEFAIGVRVEGAATVTVLCDVKIHDKITPTT